MLWMAVCLIVSFTGCTSEEMDYNNPDVTLFVKQLKTGTYKMKNDKGVVEVPHFTEEDIPELLNYAEDLTIIPSFPSVYNTNNGKIRLGECMLWVIESIRQGTAPSLGCRMVLANADNYEAIFFLTDDEVLDAAACYRRWWEGRKYPKTSWTIDLYSSRTLAVRARIRFFLDMARPLSVVRRLLIPINVASCFLVFMPRSFFRPYTRVRIL